MEKCQAPHVNELFENHYFVLLIRLKGGGGWKTVNELIYVILDLRMQQRQCQPHRIKSSLVPRSKWASMKA